MPSEFSLLHLVLWRRHTNQLYLTVHFEECTISILEDFVDREKESGYAAPSSQSHQALPVQDKSYCVQ